MCGYYAGNSIHLMSCWLHKQLFAWQQPEKAIFSLRDFLERQEEKQGRGKGKGNVLRKAKRWERQGREGKAALRHGRRQFGAEASSKPVAFSRQTGVCLPPET